MEETYCQSCAMPLTDDMPGTNADGGKNADYCKYCYENGSFTSDITMQEMIDQCVPFMATEESGMTEAQARQMMGDVLPRLKRWK